MVREICAVLLSVLLSFACEGASVSRLLHRSQCATGTADRVELLKKSFGHSQESGRVHSYKVPDIDRSYRKAGRMSGRVLSASQGESTLFGYMGYSEADNFMAGLYNFTFPGFAVTWEDQIYQDATMCLQTGWLKDGKVCGFIPYYYLSQLITIIYVECDLTTGAVSLFSDHDVKDGAYEICAYNSMDDHIYGYGFDEKGDWWFMRSPADRPFALEKIKPLPTMRDERQICAALTYDDKEKTLYGVNADNKLVTITPLGVQHEKMQLSQYALPYVTGLCRSTRDDLFYWNAIIKAPGYLSEVSYLYTLDPAKGKVTEIDEFENGEQFMFLINTDKTYPEDYPGAADVVSIDFDEGASSGSVEFGLPSSTIGGASITQTIAWEILLDGESYGKGEGEAAQSVKSSFDDLAEGMHYITLAPSLGNKTGPSAYVEIYIGNDTPSAPANVVLTRNEVCWNPVTTGLHGGYVDASKVRYKVYLNDVYEGETSETRMPVSISTKMPLSRYEAKVEAVYGDKVSEAALSNAIVEGAPLQLDVQLDPTAKQVTLMLTEDVNGDGYGWSYDSENMCLVSDYSENGPMDDWVFMPVTDFPDKDVMYEVLLDAKAGNVQYSGEEFEVAFGNAPTPDAMRTTVISCVAPEGSAFTEYRGLFGIEAAMSGYVGIHACSAENQYGMLFKNIRIRRTNVQGDSPNSPTELKAVAVPGGEHKAEVSFRFPESLLNGIVIPENAVLEAKVKTGVSDVTVSGKPGTVKTLTVDTKDGVNVIEVRAIFDGKESDVATVQVYTGMDVPATVKKLEMSPSADMMSVNMSWEAPLTGYNGGYINPADMTYDIYQMVYSTQGSGWQMIDSTTELNYTFSLPAESEQQMVQLGVVSKNNKGDCGRVVSALELLGKPFELPIHETYSGKDGFDYYPWIIYSPTDAYNADWGVGYFSQYIQGEEGFGVIGTGNVLGAYGRLGMPRFSTAGMADIDMIIHLWEGKDAANTKVLASAYGLMDPVELYATKTSDKFNEITIRFPEQFDNRGWVQVYFDSQFASSASIAGIGEISINGKKSSIAEVYDGSPRFEVQGLEGAIRISGYRGLTYGIYDVDGRNVASGELTAEVEIKSLAQGLYIVRLSDRSVKIMVR